jgi:hypothetical protein
MSQEGLLDSMRSMERGTKDRQLWLDEIQRQTDELQQMHRTFAPCLVPPVEKRQDEVVAFVPPLKMTSKAGGAMHDWR